MLVWLNKKVWSYFEVIPLGFSLLGMHCGKLSLLDIFFRKTVTSFTSISTCLSVFQARSDRDECVWERCSVHAGIKSRGREGR